jgi:flavin-dependent dehydrogenase
MDKQGEPAIMHNVIVVGAGPAGSTLAAVLAQQGWNVLLIERHDVPRHKVCGEFLSPDAQDTLCRLGLLKQLAALSPVPLSHAQLTTPAGTTLRTDLPGQAWGLSRYTLDAALAAAARQQGVTLWTGTTVTGWQAHGNGYDVHLRGDGQAAICPARAVIMACGRHTLPGLPPRPASSRRLSGWRRCVGVKAHYTNVSMTPQVELFLFPGGYVGINPVEGERVNVCLLMDYQRFMRAGKSVTGVMTAVTQWNSAFARRMHGAQRVPGTTCAAAPVDTERRAEPWAGLACLGDTAAMMPPLCGDGMAMALRSAMLCAPLADAFMRGKLTLAAWEQAYTAAWQDEFRQRLRLGRWLQGLLGQRGVRDVLIGLGQRLPAMADYLMQATRGAVTQPAYDTR